MALIDPSEANSDSLPTVFPRLQRRNAIININVIEDENGDNILLSHSRSIVSGNYHMQEEERNPPTSPIDLSDDEEEDLEQVTENVFLIDDSLLNNNRNTSQSSEDAEQNTQEVIWHDDITGSDPYCGL